MDKVLLPKWLVLTSVMIISFVLPSTHAASRKYFDVDDTPFYVSRPRLANGSGEAEPGAKIPAIWPYWILILVDHVNNGWHYDQYKEGVRSGALPHQILVTADEAYRLRGKLATRDGRNGSDFAPFPLLEDPIHELGGKPFLFGLAQRPDSIIPGFYMEIPPITWIDHDDFKTGQNNFLRQVISGIKRFESDPEKYEFRGVAYDIFNYSLKQQDAMHTVILTTDRNPASAGSMTEGLKFLYRKGYLVNPERKVGGKIYSPRLASMSSIDGRMLTSMFDFGRRKGEQIAADMALLQASPTPKHELIRPELNNPQGRTMLGHEVMVVENEPNYNGMLFNKLKHLAATFTNVKFVLYNAGFDHQVLGAANNPSLDPTKVSRYTVFLPNGSGWRLPVAEELAEWEPPKGWKGCEGRISGFERITKKAVNQ